MSGWQILVADDLSPEGLEILAKAGAVTVKKGLAPAELARELPPYHALVVRSATRVGAESLVLAEKLVVIGRAGIGIDNIDVEAATARGIVVMNTPESGAVTTAELAVALLLALARKVPLADRLLRQKKWEKGRLMGVEVTGKTLGLLGLGRIGRVVADRAAGLRMRVIAHDPHVPEGRVPPGVLLVPFERCLAESDFVSVHVPLLDSTRHLLDAKALALMKQGSRLIHCARGGIVDEAALADALRSGRLAGAALDVFEQEPLRSDHPLLELDSVVLTPHLGASTEEARRVVAIDIANQVVDCLRTGLVVNGVNVPHVSPADADFLHPFLLLAERLGSLLVQAFPGRLSRVHLITQGEVGERNQRPVQIAALTGALRPGAQRPVTAVSAESVARDAGVEISAERSTLKKDFVNLVRVEVTVDGSVHAASGTLIGTRHLRMVEIDEFLLDAIPEGHLLMTLHSDRPGVIGRIGTLLGESGINISRLQLGVTRERSGQAVGILNVDAPVPEAVLAALRALPDVVRVTSISL